MKKVYLNDVPISEASSWAGVHKLLRTNRIVFAGKPGMAEGPTGFYISGSFAASGQISSEKATQVGASACGADALPEPRRIVAGGG